MLHNERGDLDIGMVVLLGIGLFVVGMFIAWLSGGVSVWRMERKKTRKKKVGRKLTIRQRREEKL